MDDAKDWAAAVRATAAGVVLDLEVVPGSSKPGFPLGFNPWRKRIQARVVAPAEAGRANEELVQVVAAALRVPRAAVALVDGATSRRKSLLVAGVDLATALARIAEAFDGR